MSRFLPKTIMMALPLTGLLLGGCTPHERFHHRLGEMHEEFHESPHTRAEHERFHDDLRALHEDAHDRGYSSGW